MRLQDGPPEGDERSSRRQHPVQWPEPNLQHSVYAARHITGPRPSRTRLFSSPLKRDEAIPRSMTLLLSFKEARPKGEACPHDFRLHSRLSAVAPCPVAPYALSSHPHLPPRRGDHRLLNVFFFFSGWMFPGVSPKAGQVPREVGPGFNCTLSYTDDVSSPLSDGSPPRCSTASTSLFQESGCDEVPLRRRLPRRGREERKNGGGGGLRLVSASNFNLSQL